MSDIYKRCEGYGSYEYCALSAQTEETMKKYRHTENSICGRCQRTKKNALAIIDMEEKK